MSTPEILTAYRVTKDYDRHLATAGKHLGGVDYAMPIGTPLPILDGQLEWVTPQTPAKSRPAWYNTGLGNAAAYLRPDGTRTVYGHCSRVDGRQVYSGNTGLSTGPHLHTHDVLADGTTRARPFSTITASRKRKPMLLFHTADPTAPRGVRYHIITADGREAQFTSGGTEFPNGIAGQLGSSVATDRALLDAFKSQLRSSGPPAGKVTLDAAAVVDELLKRLKA